MKPKGWWFVALAGTIAFSTYLGLYLRLRYRYAADVGLSTSYSLTPVTVIPDTTSGRVRHALFFPLLWSDRKVSGKYFHIYQRHSISYSFLHLTVEEQFQEQLRPPR